MLWCGLLCLGFSHVLLLRAEVIDRLVAVVNRQIITLGDVEKEMRLQELDPLTGDATGMSSSQQQKVTQELLVQRLIEQMLIREQIQQFPGLEIADEQVESQVAAIEKKVGGAEKLAQMKVDNGALRDRLRWQLQVMKFIDYRFRQFVVVDTKEIEAYYQNQFLPELQKRNVLPAPELAEVEERIRKILIEEKLNNQVDEWLASLRKDATIEIFH
jgi:peptidyl-prolyl cis-trans isomerase SurA